MISNCGLAPGKSDLSGNLAALIALFRHRILFTLNRYAKLLLLFFFSLLPMFASGQHRDPEITITKFQNQLDQLTREVVTLEDRILTYTDAGEVKVGAIYDLGQVGKFLDSTDKDLNTLIRMFQMAVLVTDKSRITLARKSVEVQQTYTTKMMAVRAGSLEKTMHLTRDKEISRLKLQARDLLREASNFLSTNDLSTLMQ